MESGRVAGTGGPVLLHDAIRYAIIHEWLDFPASVLRQSAPEMRRMIELNLSTPVELCRQVLPGMVARGRGHVVTISSIGSTAVFPGLAVYSATKAGLAHFTAGLRADLRGLPVRTTLVELGPVPTETLHDAKQFPPAAASYRRAYRTHLLVDVPLASAADRIVRGVERNARTVRTPAGQRRWAHSSRRRAGSPSCS